MKNYLNFETDIKNLENAFNTAMEACEKRRKKRLNSYKNSEICVVMFINNKETTDKQKIEYAEKYYGKEIAQKSFALNKNILKNPKILLAKKEPPKKKKIVKKKVAKKKAEQKLLEIKKVFKYSFIFQEKISMDIFKKIIPATL